MAKYLRVTMTDGSQWDIPASLIAHDRATFYAESDAGRPDGEEFDRSYREEVEYTLSNDDEIVDWAANNMNWVDVAQDARRVRDPEPLNLQCGWLDGEKRVVDR